MKKIVLAFILTMCAFLITQAQYKLNDYKYVIVEKQFHFQNEENEYHLNRLVKFLFEKHGFDAIIEGEPLPDDLKSNYCLALTSRVKAKGALRTKAYVILTDCDNNVVYTSPEGITKEKDFRRSYEMAIRSTFEHFESLGYNYIPSERILSQGRGDQTTEQSKEDKKEIQELKAEIAELKQEKEESLSDMEKEVSPSTTDVKKETSKALTATAVEKGKEETLHYRAVMTRFGYELVPSKEDSPKYAIYSTRQEGVYLIRDPQGIVYKKGDVWGMEYLKGGKTIFEPMDIRF